MAFTYNPQTGLPTNRRQPWQTALGARSTGLNQQYGLGQFAQPPGGAGGGGGQQYGPINLPGFTPDYKALISQALGPLQAQLGAEGSSDVAGRNSALIRGLAQFGEQFDPSGAQAAFGQDFYNQAGLGDLLGQANQLAGENTKAGFSFKARSQSAFEKSVQQIQDALAARGMLRSGATGVALQGAQKEFDTSQYDARMQLADYASSVQQGYVAGQRARQSQLDSAQREEAERQARLNPPTGERTLQYAGKDPSGRPFYKGDDGKLYYDDNTPYTPEPIVDPPIVPATPDPIGPARTRTDPLASIQAALTRGREQRLGF